MADWPPRVLSNLYRNGLRTFHDLLLDVVVQSLKLTDGESGEDSRLRATDVRKQAEERLIEEGDPEEYATLLQKSYAVMPERAPALGRVSFEQRWTQEQIVERVVVLQFQQEDKPSHVLCAGYRKLRPSVGKSSLRRSPHGLECACENSAVNIVNSPSWKILLSRVGDLIMLHLLTHAAVFFPLPNNCFLQVSGGPTGVVSKSAKYSSIHPGEKMLGGVACKKPMSVSYTPNHNQIGSHLWFSGVEDEGKQPGCNAETPPDDTTSVADESKQAYAGIWEIAGEKATNIVRNQTSNFTSSPRLKRRRADSTRTGLKVCIREGDNKYHDFEGKIVSKRQRCESGEQVCMNGEGSSNDAAFTSGRNSLHDMSATISKATIQNLCSRTASEGTSVQYSGHHKGILDDLTCPDPNNFKKRRRLPRQIEKDRHSQPENKLDRIPYQQPTNSNVMVPWHDKSGRDSKKNTQCSIQREGSAHKDKLIPILNQDLGDSPVAQDSCASPSQNAIAVSSGKRIRLPSWKRKKLRQAQESSLEFIYKDLPLEGCGERDSGFEKQLNNSELQMPVATVDEVAAKTGNEESHLSASRVDQFPSSHKREPGYLLERIAGEKSSGNLAPRNKAQRKNSQHGPGITYSIPEKLIDRSPIFYNSSYSCHPGLPAKHILNTAKPDETGAARLFSAVFGSQCSTSVCSSPGSHMYANCSRAKLNPGQISQFQSAYKLLQQLLLNARRCAFARLLGRHCPLPEGFHSIHKDDPPVSGLPLESQTPTAEQKGLDDDIDQDERQGVLSPDHAPEIEEIMSMWLGPNYQLSEIPSPKRSKRNSMSPSKMVQQEKSKCKETITKTNQLKQDNPRGFPLDDNLTFEKNKQAELISCHTAHSKVVGFLWAVCRSIIPKDMLGCVRSWRALRSSIAHFVSLRRHEKFNVKHSLFRLQLSSFPWLAFNCNENNSSIMPETPPAGRVTDHESVLKQRRLEMWLYWLFTGLLVPLIRAHFYVTEHENHRQNIFYYRKPVWARIRSNGVRELTNKNYKKLTKQAVAQVLTSRVLGFSQIRLLPKRTGLRPIANLAASSQGTLRFSIQTKQKATLTQVFGNLPKELPSIDWHRSNDKLFSFPHQSPPMNENLCQGSAVEPFEACPSKDAEKKALTAKYSSCSPSSGKTRESTIFLKSSDIQKRCRKTVNFSFRSINSVLKDAYCCLKLEKDDHPEDLGSSVFGYCDVHEKVLPFIMQWKGSPNGMPRLFMAVCDVTKAYDTIPQEKLQEIVEGFVQSSDYKVARYTCIIPTLASVRVSHGRSCAQADQPKKFVDSVRDLATKRSHCIFMDQAFRTSLRRDQVLSMVGEHVKQNIVQIGSDFYQQKVGIPQGSILSSLLCSLFYGHFDVHGLLPFLQSHSTESSNRVLGTHTTYRESNGESDRNGLCRTLPSAKVALIPDCDIEELLKFSMGISDDREEEFLRSYPPAMISKANSESRLSELQDKSTSSSFLQNFQETGTCERNSMLLRLIDDSLFISSSERGAKIFVESMHMGSNEYGCQANEKKTATSFPLQLGDKFLPRKVYTSEDGACFMRWSGLLVNCFTLEFQADYTRYCGEHIRSALTVRMEHNQGWQLVLKMCQYMRPKCHALFFDPRINSPATIRLNAFQAFLLCAMKFHAYVCCLSHVTGINEPFLFKAIDCVIRYMYGLLRHKMASVGAEAVAYFPYKELEWLAFIAFYRVLKRKQARYQILLRLLQTQLQTPKYQKLRPCPHLSSAIDERRSSMFKFIKY